MTAAREPGKFAVTTFRARLLVAMMLVVSTVTALALYTAQRNAAADVEGGLQREFHAELGALDRIQTQRHDALAERCRVLVRRPRIHAALEDDALDLLYPSARDELHDLMQADNGSGENALQARFYRFLDRQGAVIVSPNTGDVGKLSAQEEARLSFDGVPREQEIGYLFRKADDPDESITEVICMPIISSETSEVIAALVVGFKPVDMENPRVGSGIKSGLWLDGRLHLPTLDQPLRGVLGGEVARIIATPDSSEKSFTVKVEGTPHLLFYKRLNPASLFPPAYEVCIYPLTELLARQRRLRWQIVGAGVALLLVALTASHFISGRLSKPVEKLAVDSDEHRAQKERAEAALELTSEELQRAARFSADASHQLKTPVAVLRAGLEELLSRDHLTPEMCDEIAVLIHQTYRLTNIVEDLLLLSRMDAGRLQIEFSRVNLMQLIEALLDDLSAMPDGLDLNVETHLPASLHVTGEQRYLTLILQNLLENARKYNLPGGRIVVTAREDGECVAVTVGNTGRPIPAEARENIFQRFHRGSIGENVPGHGLGLNLARELARMHRGDLRLIRSEDGWTEFEMRLWLSMPVPADLEFA